MTRFVFDTNVIISAVLFNNSVPGQAFIRALNHGRILVSRALVGELSRVLGRDRFDRYVTREERDAFLSSLIRESSLIEISQAVQVCRDPEDDQILELAVNGNATYIVTGDADLLVLNPFRGIEIVTPAEFLILDRKKKKWNMLVEQDRAAFFPSKLRKSATRSPFDVPEMSEQSSMAIHGGEAFEVDAILARRRRQSSASATADAVTGASAMPVTDLTDAREIRING